MIKTVLHATLTTLAGVGLAFGIYAMGVDAGQDAPAPRPYCPTEDSCMIDYAQGEWTVYEVTP